MKIIDAFIFYNELDLLYYRLSVLYAHVDKFVLVEATLTFAGNPKPLYYSENKDRFSQFADKIIHVVVDDLKPNAVYIPGNGYDDDVWENEFYQRNCIDRGIKQLDLMDEDLIMISDLDEIPNMNSVYEFIRATLDTTKIAISLEQDMYYYNLTTKQQCKWHLAKIVSYKFYLKNIECTP